jgi:hypothetical protein
MKLYGLTEWPLMEPQRHLLMNWFMGIMQSYLGKYNQILEKSFAKGFKLQRLQWLNVG